MEKKTFDIQGMSCAACAAKVQRGVMKLSGVTEADVNLLQNRMTVLYDEALTDKDAIISAVSASGYGATLCENKGHSEKKADEGESRRQKIRLTASLILALLLIALATAPLFSLIVMDNVLAGGIMQALLALSVMYLQRRYFQSALKALRHVDFNMDTLISLGSGVSFIYSLCILIRIAPDALISEGMGTDLYFDTAAAVLTFVAVGKYFEERTKVKTADAVSMLCDLSPKFVRVKREDEFVEIPLENCRIGDVIAVRGGDQIGIDGIVVKGEGFTDESSISGESRPVKKTVGSEIISSSLLTNGYIEVKATAVGEDTVLQRIIALVDEAVSKKAPVARTADLIASIFVPVVIALSLLTFCIWFLVMGAPLNEALTFAVSVLVISCPCALGLATPLAIVAGTGRAARAGILFKSPEIIEKLSRATVYAFDKTGTLTVGNMDLTALKCEAGADESIIRRSAAALESQSKHPLSQSLVKSLGEKDLPPVTAFTAVAGRGIEGKIADEIVRIGNMRFVREQDCRISPELLAFASVHEEAGDLVLYYMCRGEVAAIICLCDELKASSKQTVQSLAAMGIQSLMLTGDAKKTAAAVASKLGISNFRSELMPAQKAEIIKDLQDSGHRVIMVGDGVNDSVALATAYAGISLKGASDIAVSSCSTVLLSGRLYDCVNAAVIARKTMRVIKENLFWAFIYNIIFIPVAAGCFSFMGWHLTPVAGAIMMSASSLCVCLNALRLTRIKLCYINDKKDEKMEKRVIDIDGMMCAHCEASVKKALLAIDGVQEVEASHEQRLATVYLSKRVDDEALAAAVRNAGYEVKGVHA